MFTLFAALSVYARYEVILQWQISKGNYARNDSLTNTGLWRFMLRDIVLVLLAPAPFLNGVTFREKYVDLNAEMEFEINTLLLALAVFIRSSMLFRVSLSVSYFMSPRS